MKLSKYFTLEEAQFSEYAAGRGLDNTIPAAVRHNVQRTADRLDAVREILGAPVYCISWYRSPEVNKGVRGTRTSAHCGGLAVDFRAPGYGSPKEIIQKLLEAGVKFDQLILEYNSWVHIGFRENETEERQEVLTATKGLNGRPQYSRGVQ